MKKMAMRTPSISYVVGALMIASVTAGVTAVDGQNWPLFRGRAAGAVADDPRLPDSWSATENVAWKIDLPGLGWSSPIVWGDFVFVTSASTVPNERIPVPGLDRGEG